MFDRFRELTGFEPVQQPNGTFIPSPSSLKVAAPEKTDYDHATYPNALFGSDKKVLVICTQDGTLVTQNGDRFDTGNHPVELFVVLLHLEKAGFGIDIATSTGLPVPIETWAMPTEDQAVMDIVARYQTRLNAPLSLDNVIAQDLGDASPYVAVFIPGGHGAVLGLPHSLQVKDVLQWALATNRHLISLCHGPAAFLSLSEGELPENFPLKGYSYASFPDSSDTIMTGLGYLPGKMPWFFNEKLEQLGMDSVSLLPVGKTHEDRRLLTGDGPMAANELGGMAARRLLDIYAA